MRNTASAKRGNEKDDSIPVSNSNTASPIMSTLLFYILFFSISFTPFSSYSCSLLWSNWPRYNQSHAAEQQLQILYNLWFTIHVVDSSQIIAHVAALSDAHTNRHNNSNAICTALALTSSRRCGIHFSYFYCWSIRIAQGQSNNHECIARWPVVRVCVDIVAILTMAKQMWVWGRGCVFRT